MGEGDCDSDSDCAGDLVCGTDNCQNYDSAFSSTHDCCETGNKIIQWQAIIGIFKKKCGFYTSGCNAILGMDNHSCCTSSYPCVTGEGDCDSDSDCAGDLVCGTDNCRNFDSAYTAEADCCTLGKNHITAENMMLK